MNIEKYFVDNNIIWKFITLLSFPIWNYRIIFCMDQVEKFFLYKSNKTNKFKKFTKIKVICSYIHSIYTHVFGDQLKKEYTKIIAALHTLLYTNVLWRFQRDYCHKIFPCLYHDSLPSVPLTSMLKSRGTVHRCACAW